MSSDNESNFLEINKNINIKILYDYIKLILKNKKNSISTLLIITDRGPLFGTKFINIVLLFYAHILKVNVSFLYMGERGKEKNNLLLSYKLLTKILGYNLNINFFYDFDYKKIKGKVFDLVLINIDVLSIGDFYLDTNFQYKKIVVVGYDDIILNNLFSKKIEIDFILRYKLSYWFFSKIIYNLYYKDINFSDRKYDILIAGTIKGRDFNLIKYIISKNNSLKICIISGRREEIKKINEIIGESKNIDYVLNFNSYSEFYNILNNSKIFLNCINIGDESTYGYGSTGLLLALSGKYIILSKDTRFYRKYISENETGFFYDTYSDCINEIERILNLSVKKIYKIKKNRYNDFNSNKQIEEYCDIFFSK